jgi:heme iron utilization protein
VSEQPSGARAGASPPGAPADAQGGEPVDTPRNSAVDTLRNATADTSTEAAVDALAGVGAGAPAGAAAEAPVDAPAWATRKLLRAARSGTLATLLAGQPFASLVTPATAPDLALLLLLSSLSEHTRHLRAEPRCSVLVVGTATGANPQTTPRATITGLAEAIDDPGLKARYLAVHPYASLYADFGDFALWRIRPMGGLYVGGFARAARLRREDLTPEPDAVAAIATAAAGIMAHCNEDHADAMAWIAGAPGAWRMVAVDVDGCDLAQGEQVIRVPWSAPVVDPDGVRAELLRLARAAG